MTTRSTAVRRRVPLPFLLVTWLATLALLVLLNVPAAALAAGTAEPVKPGGGKTSPPPSASPERTAVPPEDSTQEPVEEPVHPGKGNGKPTPEPTPSEAPTVEPAPVAEPAPVEEPAPVAEPVSPDDRGNGHGKGNGKGDGAGGGAAPAPAEPTPVTATPGPAPEPAQAAKPNPKPKAKPAPRPSAPRTPPAARPSTGAPAPAPVAPAPLPPPGDQAAAVTERAEVRSTPARLRLVEREGESAAATRTAAARADRAVADGSATGQAAAEPALSVPGPVVGRRTTSEPGLAAGSVTPSAAVAAVEQVALQSFKQPQLPLFVIFMIVSFLLVQHWLDRRDVKISGVRVEEEDDLLFPRSFRMGMP